MLYRLIKWIMSVALRLFYKRVYLTGAESIPLKHPVILVANHPSSLMDAALLGVLFKRPLYFFTRGDVFSNKPASAIMRALHMIPVYDHEAGRETITHNDKSFETAKEILAAGGMIIF